MITSILNSVKKGLGLDPEYLAFDDDLILYINGVFSTLQQLGVGPADGFEITGADEEWEAFYGSDKGYNAVQNYMVLRVRLMFDAPQNSFTVQALKEQIEQLEWRLNVHREGVDVLNEDEATNVDGGAP